MSQKLLQNFINFFSKFHEISAQFFRGFWNRSFKNFLEIIRTYPVISAKFLQKNMKSFWNFWTLISRFLGKTPTNAKFFRVSSELVYCSHFRTLFQCFPKIIFRTSPNFFKIVSYNFSMYIFPQFPKSFKRLLYNY